MILSEEGEVLYSKDEPKDTLQQDLCKIIRCLKEAAGLNDDEIQLAVASGLAGINFEDLPKK